MTDSDITLPKPLLDVALGGTTVFLSVEPELSRHWYAISSRKT